MPVADPQTYARMLDAAREGKYAYPAINITSTETVNAALRGFAEAGSDGLIQVSTGGGEFASGTHVKNMAVGAIALAEFIHRIAENYDDQRRHHDRPLPARQGRLVPAPAARRPRASASSAARARSSSTTCSTAPSSRSRRTWRSRRSSSRSAPSSASCSRSRPASSAARRTASTTRASTHDKLYTTPEDMVAVAEALGTGEKGKYVFAATFGNVHGVYKPGEREAQADDPPRRPGRGRGAVRRRGALRPRLPRRLRLGARGDPRDARLRRHQDERGHGHAVRVHPPDRRPHAEELRRRPEGRRRGRQQEAVRPARLPQGGRGRDGRPRRPGVRGPALDRQVDRPPGRSRRRSVYAAATAGSYRA